MSKGTAAECRTCCSLSVPRASGKPPRWRSWASALPGVRCYDFDAIGIPSVADASVVHSVRIGRQPELDTPDMDRWAVYLKSQADALGVSVIDTTALSCDQVADQVQALFTCL